MSSSSRPSSPATLGSSRPRGRTGDGPDFARIAANTNKRHQAIVQGQARRYAVCEWSDCHLGDRSYFGRYAACLTQEAADAYLYYLLNQVDLRGWEIRDLPETEIRRENLLQNRPSPSRFLADYDWGYLSSDLQSWVPGGLLTRATGEEAGLADVDELYSFYEIWCRSSNERWIVNSTEFRLAAKRELRFRQLGKRLLVKPHEGQESAAELPIEKISWPRKARHDQLPCLDEEKKKKKKKKVVLG